MKFLVTDIEFDFNTDMPDYYSVSFDDQQLIVNDNFCLLYTSPSPRDRG